MSVEVACPQCKSILHAPDEAAGRRVRCKKCQHGFRLPGEKQSATDGDSVADSTHLSVIREFDFAAEPAEPTDSPSKSKYRTGSTDKAKRSSFAAKSAAGWQPPPRRGKKLLFAVLVLAAGIGTAIYFSLDAPKKPVAVAAPTVAPPVADKPAAKAEDVKKKWAGDPKPEAAAPPKIKDFARKSTTILTGGLKLPAAPGKIEKMQKPLAVAAFGEPLEKVRRLFLGGGDSPVGVILHTSYAGFAGKGAKDKAVRFNLTSGDKLDETEIEIDGTTWPRAGDLSPSGELFLSEGPVGKVTLYNLGQKARAGEPIEVAPSADKARPATLAAAYFLDEDKFATIARNGIVEVWDAKTRARLVAGNALDKASNLTDRRTVGIKADRSAAVILAGSIVYEVPFKTCEAKAILTLPRIPGTGFAVSLSDSGDRIAVAYQATERGLHTVVVVARAGEAKPSLTLQLDPSVGDPVSIDWSGVETFTVITNTGVAFAVDTESNKTLAVLNSSGPKLFHAVGVGRHWCLMADPADAKKGKLVGVAFPPEEYLPLKNEADANGPIGFALTPEGLGR